MICQPLYNRGDESAHKGLLRKIMSSRSDIKVKVVWIGNNQDCIDQFNVHLPNVEYINLKGFKGFTKFSNLVAKRNCYWLSYFSSTCRLLLKLYKESDAILCAPGGINLGGFQSWNHVYLLNLAKITNKPLYYYGRSIGPFPTATPDNLKFKSAATNILNYMTFISLRDKKSEMEAVNLGISNAVKTLDSAFLDSPKVEIPSVIREKLGNNTYMVFVPNILIWHYAYRNRIKLETVHHFYCKMIDYILKALPDCNIVMLPQTFNYGNELRDDIHLFNDIATLKKEPKIIVIPDTYSSDVQQTIISGAKCLIGARYHSVVFSINQAIPFIALSYEHKITGLLETLGKTDCMVDITKSLDSEDNMEKTLEDISKKLNTIKADTEARENAKKIANDCFEQFLRIL